MFVGDSGTEGFRCAEMVEGRPWVYQADMHCIAATVHSLLFGNYMKVERMEGAAGAGAGAARGGAGVAGATGTTGAAGAGAAGGARYRTCEPLRRYWQGLALAVLTARTLSHSDDPTRCILSRCVPEPLT